MILELGLDPYHTENEMTTKNMQHFSVLRIRIQIHIDPFDFCQPDPDPGSKKIRQNHHNIQPKSLEYYKFFQKY